VSKGAAEDQDGSPARKAARKLSKAQAAHEKAEQRVTDLRARLVRAEAKLAKRAQKLLSARFEPPVPAADGAGEPPASTKATTAPAPTPPAAAHTVPASRPTRAAPAPAGSPTRRAAKVSRPSRPRTSRRPGTGKGAETAPTT